MSRNTTMAAVLVLILIVAGWYLFRPKQPAVIEEGNLITVTQAGFAPKDIFIKIGETITWKNSDTIDHTVNSAPHPTHTSYSPLNLDNIKPGQKKSLAFPKAGTYKYHDHLNPSLTGSITVQ